MATPRYWNANYWNANYWEAGYWAQVGSDDSIGQIAVTPAMVTGPAAATGEYFNANYFADKYFAEGYFSPGEAASGGTNFIGTFVDSLTYTGDISATTAATGLFTASAVQVVFFDLEVGFSPQWAFTETSTYTGTIANTLDAMTSVIPGQFSADAIGPLAATLTGDTSDITGTYLGPANFIGAISRTIQGATFNGLAIFIDDTGAIGDISVTLDNVTSAVIGELQYSDTDGALADTLETYTANWDGAFFDAATIVGPISTTFTDFAGSFSGTTIGQALVATRRSNVGNTGKRRGTNTRRVA